MRESQYQHFSPEEIKEFMTKKKKEIKMQKIEEMKHELTKRVKIYENLVHVQKEAKMVISRFRKRKDKTTALKYRFISLLKKLQRIKERRQNEKEDNNDDNQIEQYEEEEEDHKYSDDERLNEVNSDLEESSKKIYSGSKRSKQKSSKKSTRSKRKGKNVNSKEGISKENLNSDKEEDLNDQQLPKSKGNQENEVENENSEEELDEEEYNLIMQNMEVLNHIATMIQKVWRGYRGVIFEEEEEMFESGERVPSKSQIHNQSGKSQSREPSDRLIKEKEKEVKKKEASKPFPIQEKQVYEEKNVKEILITDENEFESNSEHQQEDVMENFKVISNLHEKDNEKYNQVHGYFQDLDAQSEDDEEEAENGEIFISDRYEKEIEKYDDEDQMEGDWDENESENEHIQQHNILDNIPSTYSKKGSNNQKDNEELINIEDQKEDLQQYFTKTQGIKVMSSSWSPLHSSYNSEIPENPSVFEEEPFLRFSHSAVAKELNKEDMVKLLEVRERLIETQHKEDVEALKTKGLTSAMMNKRKVELEKWVSYEKKELEKAKIQAAKGISIAPELIKKTKRDMQLALVMEQKKEVFSDVETRNLLLMSESDPFFSQSWGGSHKASHREFETPGSSIKKSFGNNLRRGSDENCGILNYGDDLSGELGELESPEKHYHNQSSPAYYSSPMKSEEMNQLSEILSKVKELPKTISHEDLCHENEQAILIEEETKPQYLNEYKANYLTSLLLEQFAEELSFGTHSFVI